MDDTTQLDHPEDEPYLDEREELVNFEPGFVLRPMVEKVRKDCRVVLDVVAHRYRDRFAAPAAAAAAGDTFRPRQVPLVFAHLARRVAECRQLDPRSTGEGPPSRRHRRRGRIL